MLSINTNLPSIIAQSSLKNSTLKLNTAVERMSTGYKINGAKDNAANYSITTNMTTKIGAYQVAEDNCAMGLDLINTASESLDLINDKLVRLRALAEQAANGTYGEQSLKAINAEANALVDEIERSYKNTEYNGINLFGNLKPQFLQEVIKRDTSSMQTLASVDENTILTSGTYSISTAEELAKLARMVNNGKTPAGSNAEFVLADNIDLSTYSSGNGWTPIGFHEDFYGTFDGNGYIISNLYINSSENTIGLFGYSQANIKNLGLENVNVTGDVGIGALVGNSDGGLIYNCYATGKVSGKDRVGGLCGWNGIFENCYTNIVITADNASGGLTGDNESSMKGDKNSYYTSENHNGIGTHISLSELQELISVQNPSAAQIEQNTITLQVGINSSKDSQINIDTTFGFSTASLRGIGVYMLDYLAQIDTFINTVSAKQTEFGAVQNRLESALDEISTQYENLVSSRSTLQDADIAEVSSEYIRQQILQQASATLLSTANQTPALALQLL